MGLRNRNVWRGRAVMMAISAIGMLSASAPAALANGGGGSFSPAPSGPQVDPAESYREGVEALQAGDYRTAERRFGEVLRVARDHPESNYYMGLAKIGQEKHKASLKYFERAFKERPDFVEAREQFALVSIQLDKADDGAEQLAALRELKDSCASEECDAAFSDRLDEAIVKVEAALGGEATGEETGDVSWAPSLDEGAVEYRSAVKLINQDRYEEAIGSLYRSSANVGPHADIYNYLGFAHRKLGQFDKAQDYYAQALKLAPDHLGATEYLGELYLELGNIRKAKRQLARLDALCDFGCAEREELAALIEIRESVRSASRD